MEPIPPPDGGIPTTPFSEPTSPKENPITSVANQEKIVTPFSFKKIGVFFVNTVLFFIYFFLLAFFVGFFGGILGLLISPSFTDSELFKQLGSFIAFVLLIIITLFFRKKIYIKIVKT